MVMSWVLLSILAALCFAIVNVFDKYLLSKLNLKPIIPLIGLGVTGFILSILIFVVHGFTLPSWPHVLIALAGGAIYALMNIFYLEAAKREDISRVAPLFHLSPIYILVFSYFFLHESLALYQYVGVLLLVVGAITLGYKKNSKITTYLPLLLMLFAALFWAGNQVITKYLLAFDDYWTVFAYIRIGTFLVLMPELLANLPDIKKIFKVQGAIPFTLIGVGELFNLGGLLLAAIAATVGSITLVNALSSVQPLFLLMIVIVFSVFSPRIMREELSRESLSIKIFAIALLIVGVVLIG